MGWQGQTLLYLKNKKAKQNVAILANKIFDLFSLLETKFLCTICNRDAYNRDAEGMLGLHHCLVNVVYFRAGLLDKCKMSNKELMGTLTKQN